MKPALVCAVVVLASLVVLAGCGTETADPYYDLGDFSRVVTTENDVASEWFRRGLLQSYGFNHEEAVRCFETALEKDPEMAMAHWGIAYALGPNYNNPVMEPAAAERAYESSRAAARLFATCTPGEKALIGAMEMRYAWPEPEDRTHLNTAYANAMREVHRSNPDDPDVAALFSEALMMLSPWMLWSPEGAPAEVTPEIRSVLEPALERWPDHPALCHLYIHTMEPSPDPGAALAAANRLRNRVPDAGHLVHMPSHIDVLLGDYAAVIEANRRAIVADKKFVEKEGRHNFFTLYRLHDYHFLVYGAMFDGQRQLALDTARELVTEIPPELLADIPDFLEAFVSTPFHVQVRYGLWEEILAEPEAPADQPYTTAVRHYARTLAFASLGRVPEAEAEYEALRGTAATVPESRLMFNNSCDQLLRIAVLMAHGEVQYRKGDFDVAFAVLREAVKLDDALNYDEPWGWMQPVRHALGALLLEQAHIEEAEDVFRADLRRHPRNGWALMGLAEALERGGNLEEAAATRVELTASWVRADIPATVSCYCRTGNMPA